MTLEEKRQLAVRLADLAPNFFLRHISRQSAPSALDELFARIERRQKAILVEAYVEHLTREEIVESVRFLESDVGLAFTRTWAIVLERMRRTFPTLAREAAKDAGLDDGEISRALRSQIGDNE